MCIRDRHGGALRDVLDVQAGAGRSMPARVRPGSPGSRADPCLLYTSDAADERSSVDLGGRRIIKKKKL